MLLIIDRLLGRSANTSESDEQPIQIAFMCVQNAGRSQIATAFAERDRERRNLTEHVEILTGGTRPADHVHEVVVEAMTEEGFDLSDQTPGYVDLEELRTCDYLVTMGCSISEFNPASFGVDSREWTLANPEGEDLETVREIRDEIEERVRMLFNVIEDKHETAASRSSNAV